MSKYHANRIHEYKVKQLKNKEYVDKLNKMVEKRNVLFKEVKNVDYHDGTVESYEYNPQTEHMKRRLTCLDGQVRALQKKVERTC